MLNFNLWGFRHYNGIHIVRSEMKCCFALPAVKGRRHFELNKHQKSVLEASFMVQFFPNKTTLNRLALQTGLDVQQVYRWFNSKRFKTRKEKGDKL